MMASSSPHSVCTARHTATAAPMVAVWALAAGSDGRSTTEQYTPLPAGLAKLRPSRPRPAVCPPASTSVPWAAPSSASSFAVRLVLSSVSYSCTGAG